jgi:hypothetical protein
VAAEGGDYQQDRIGTAWLGHTSIQKSDGKLAQLLLAKQLTKPVSVFIDEG